MRCATRLLVVAVLAALGACRSGSASPAAATPVAPDFVRFDGIGPHTRPIATTVPGAQRAFDQGLAFAYSFNHDEAIRSFTEVTRLDPQSPMGFWGLALSCGPHINNPVVPPERERAGWEAAQRALALQDRADPTERALIAAVARRFSDSPASDRAALDRAYAEGMRAAWAAHPDDADVGALCAEALMDLHPWDLWTVDGAPKEGAAEIVALLEQVLALDPNHPAALHFYIHAVEASSDPGRALAAADRLRALVPVAGHMLHMPSHIDVLLGHWDEAIAANQRALAADAAYRVVRPQQEFHHVYMAHNQQMLSFAAMMSGRSALAIEASRQVAEGVPDEYARRQTLAIEPFFPVRYDALVRFGRWDEILAEPAPPDYQLYTTAMWRFARGVALAAKGDVARARAEQAAFAEAASRLPPERMVAVNPASRVLGIAGHELAGEVAYRAGDIDGAVAELREALALEDQLVYMEPPEWCLPVRHTLGAILLDAGRVAEAEAVYRADLAQWPNNGWSLHGLAECLRQRGDAPDEAAQAEAHFRAAWARSDVAIGSSCLCVRGR
jgi:tetratricopeptide (TPR) repeat protein